MTMLRSPEPTAEQVIQATEAAYLLNGQTDLASIARFMSLDVAIQHQRQQVEHAILAAQMLKLAVPRGRRQNRYTFSPLVPLIVKARNEDKRVFFRVHLEQYEPFILFAERLRAGIQPQEAAVQVCAIRDFADDPVVAWRAFQSWGTYARSLVRAEDGQYVPAAPFEASHLLSQSLEILFTQEQEARQFIHDHLEQEAFEFIEGNVRDSLVDAILMLTNENESERVILRVGNTYEDFLRLIGYRRVNLQNVHGIIQLGNRLRDRRLISRKHLGAVHLIGHIRNATDHGGDPDEGNRSWQVTPPTARLMILTVLSSIHSIVLYRKRGILEL
jgi:hypothetical protein